MRSGPRGLCLALGVAAAASLCGCASGPDISTIKTEGAENRLLTPAVVAYEGVQLLGEELTPEARARFVEQRLERIRLRAERAGESPAKEWSSDDTWKVIECVIRTSGICAPVLAVGIPVAMVLSAAALKTLQGVTYVGGSLLEPSLRLSAEQAEHVATVLRERATGQALVERVLYTGPGQFASEEEAESLLMVRMSARNCEAEGEPAICLVADAEGFHTDGTALPPTQHVFVQRPLGALAADRSGHLERTIEHAMDLLAESIVAAYTGSGPLANPPPEEAPPAPHAEAAGVRVMTDAERAVFPRTSASGCIRDGC